MDVTCKKQSPSLMVGREAKPVPLIQDFLVREGVLDSARFVGSSIYLDGSVIPNDRWASLVLGLRKIESQISNIVVLASLKQHDWEEIRQLREAVVHAGGILDEIGYSGFDRAVAEWARESRTDETRSNLKSKDYTEQSPEPVGPAPNWDLYRGSYLNKQELGRFFESISKKDRDSGSVIS